MNISLVFVNHYQTKLPLENPQFDIFLVIIFFLIYFLTLKKKDGDSPLSITQTNQLKGIAILLIILNHLCYYTEPLPSLYTIWSEVGMIGVSIFFVFSGYGTCISIQKRGVKDFFTKKMFRIFIPLIYAMSLLLGLYATLTKEIQNGLFLEIPSILFAMRSIDRKLWFIIFILSWYCLLYIGTKLNLCNQHKLFLLLIFSFAIIMIPDMPYVAKGNALSFPFGCWLGFNYSIVIKKLNTFIKLRLRTILLSLWGLILLDCLLFWSAETLKIYAYQIFFVAILILVIISSIYLLYKYKFEEIKQVVSLELISCIIILSTIYFNYLNYVFQKRNFEGFFRIIYWSFTRSLANVLITSSIALIIILILKLRLYSPILGFLGKISFELYLVHNTFLIHFDFLLFRGEIIILFLIYLVSVCLMSLLLQRLSEKTIRVLEQFQTS